MNLYHRDTGKGPVLLLLHGFCESHKVWNELAGKLSQHYRVLVPDLPGFGQSEPAGESFTISAVAAIVSAWLRSKTGEPVLVAGHSLGGYVALEMLRANPQGFAGLILFQSTAYADTDEKRAGRDRTMAEIEEAGLAAFVASFLPRLFLDKGHPALAGLIEEARHFPERAVIAYVKAMRDRHDRTDMLTLFGDRILFLGGAEDTFVPVAQIKAQQALAAGIQCQVLSQSMHMGMLENPQNSLNFLQTFANHCFSRFRTAGGTK